MEQFFSYLFDAIECIANLLRYMTFTIGQTTISFMAILIFITAGSIIISIVKNINIKQFRSSRRSEE